MLSHPRLSQIRSSMKNTEWESNTSKIDKWLWMEALSIGNRVSDRGWEGR
jgi:hypothetical protein